MGRLTTDISMQASVNNRLPPLITKGQLAGGVLT